ncbi:MAG TPA: hypothetical protein VGH72_33785 [Pseudonocardia sp.]|jgi:hypothetical protein
MAKKQASAGKAQPTPADAAPEVGSDLNEQGELPLFFPCLVVEGASTSDGRTIAADALDHRALPISILAQYTNPGQEGGHAGAEVIGHLTKIWRTPGPEVTSRQTGEPFPEGTFIWQGEGVADPETTGGKLARQGHLRGNSVDLSDVDYDESFAEDDKPEINITKGTIAATTLCPIPAFKEAYVEVGGGQLEPDGDPALVASGYETLTLAPFRAADLGDECGICLLGYDRDGYELADTPDATKRKRALGKGLAMPPLPGKSDGDARYPVENGSDLTKAIKAVGRGNGGDSAHNAIRRHIIKAAKSLGLEKMLPENWKADGSLTAGAEPVHELPGIAIFSDPHLGAPTPIVIGQPRADGRREISGHIATWNECHVSYSGRCVRPPHTRTDYARFATGAARVVDETGEQRTVAVGHISMSRDAATGGHAGPTLSEAETVAFYDNQCLAVADVAAGEDAHGIWIHGLTAALSEAEVDRLLSSPPSGDWRNHGGNLELCAILSVNTPGYPVPRSRVASGEAVSLVAAGLLQAPREFVPGGGITIGQVTQAVNAALIAFFDPDNDGDIDRPLDNDDDAGDEGDEGAEPGMADRKSAALLAIGKTAALESLGIDPFASAR